VIAFGAVSAVSLAVTLALLSFPWPLAIPVALYWGVVAASVQRVALRQARGQRQRWRHALTVLRAAAFGTGIASVPAASAWLSAERLAALTPAAHSLVAANGLVLPPVLLMLALLPLPTMTGRRDLAMPTRVGTAFTNSAVRPARRGGPVWRALVWVGGMRDDFAGRWPTVDRLYVSRGGLVAATAILGALAGGTAADAAAPGLLLVDAAAAVAWGWTSAALARHQFVVGDDALHDDLVHLRPLGVVAAVLSGLYTGLLLVVGLLDRIMAPTAVIEAGTPLQVWGGHFSEPIAAAASIIVIAFALFVHVLPVLPWDGGDQLSVMHRLVGLVDMAAAHEAAGNGSPHERTGTQRNAP